MKRKILRQIAKTRMQQEGLSLHRMFKKPAKTSSSKKGDDRTLFAENWRKYVQKGILVHLNKLRPRRARTA